MTCLNLSHAALILARVSEMVSPSDVTRDPSYLNCAVFFNLMLKLGDVPAGHLTMFEVLWYSS